MSFLTRHQQAGNQLGGSVSRRRRRRRRMLPIDAIVRSKADAGLSNERRSLRSMRLGWFEASTIASSTMDHPRRTENVASSLLPLSLLSPPTCCRSIASLPSPQIGAYLARTEGTNLFTKYLYNYPGGRVKTIVFARSSLITI